LPNLSLYFKELKNNYLQKKKEFARKDVERAFGVLQARFTIISNSICIWCKKIIRQIMRACVMHNMIVEDERESYPTNFDYFNEEVNINLL
jgi:Plant transposon protein